MNEDDITDVLFIGGRSGVGKTTVALEVSLLLASAGVQHAVIEGDNLDQAYPPPWQLGVDLAERNLAALWRNYREAGYRKLVFTNTVSVLQVSALTAALGDTARSVAVLLTASDEAARVRLAKRETGSALGIQIERSNRAARELDERADASTHRVPTDGRTVLEIAQQVVDLTGWQR